MLDLKDKVVHHALCHCDLAIHEESERDEVGIPVVELDIKEIRKKLSMPGQDTPR